VINSVSSRPGYAGYVPPKPPVPAGSENAAFELAAPAPVTRPPRAGADDGPGVPGIELSRAYELASRRQSGSVPRDFLWALTGPGRAS
jgi:hypothetical protein